MSQPLPPEGSPSSPVQQLVTLIREATGNVIPPARMAFLEEVAERRAHARRLSGVAAYVHALAARELPDEWGSLIPLVTIKESYFFRAPQQFEVIRQRILPALVRARSASRQLRIWSAACARGEEPATLGYSSHRVPSSALRSPGAPRLMPRRWMGPLMSLVPNAVHISASGMWTRAREV